MNYNKEEEGGDNMTLGEILKQYRQDTGISQSELARRADVSQSLIGYIEKGVNPNNHKPVSVQLPQLAKIAKAMGMSAADLMMQSDDIPYQSKKDSVLDWIKNDASTDELLQVLAAVTESMKKDSP